MSNVDAFLRRHSNPRILDIIHSWKDEFTPENLWTEIKRRRLDSLDNDKIGVLYWEAMDGFRYTEYPFGYNWGDSGGDERFLLSQYKKNLKEFLMYKEILKNRGFKV